MKNQSRIIIEVIKALKQNNNYVEEGKFNKTLIVDHAFKIIWQEKNQNYTVRFGQVVMN